MKTIFKISTALLALGVAGCAEEGIGRSEAQERAAEVLGGEAEAASRTTVEGLPAWEVDVVMANDAVIEVKLHADNGDLLVLEDEAGPFDYSFAPIDGALSYGAIADSALAEVAGDIVK